MATPNRSHLLTSEQVAQLLQAAQGHPLEALITLALETGIRFGELLALQWEDVDTEQQRLLVRHSVLSLGDRHILNNPKEGRRTIMLTPAALEVLLRHRENQEERRVHAGEQWQSNDLVFCTTTGRYLNPKTLLDGFRELLSSAGLPHIHIHDLRSTARAQMRRRQE